MPLGDFCQSLRLCRVASLCGLVSMLWTLEAFAVTVSLRSSPPPDTIRPDHDMAQVTLAVQHDGQPLTHGHVQVKVTAPPHPRLLSTDFPIVEATTLLELASDLQPNGTFSFDYLFPIRGVYTFHVALQPVAGSTQFAPTAVQTPWRIHENPSEIRNAWLLVLGLFLLGGVFGLILARSARAKSALIVTVLLASTALGVRAEGDVRAQTETSKTQHVVRGEHGWALQVDATPAQATVGQPVRFDMALTKDGQVFAEETALAVELHHIEDDKPIFKTHILAPRGETSEQLQFFDGAPHRVMITAHPANRDRAGEPPLQAVFEMEVNAIHPPMAVELRTLALFIGVLTIGMVVGWFCPLSSKETGGAPIC